MAKLFKGKRQQEVQNGTKTTGSITNLKAKVRLIKCVTFVNNIIIYCIKTCIF